jgi:hydroxymethylglutaryl-CoA lyase
MYNDKINYTMLVPNKLNECIASNIRSFGLICTISDNFAKSNLKKSADESIDYMFSQLDNIVLLSEYHVRIYISCSFGEPPDGNLEIELSNKLMNLLDKIDQKIKKNYIESDNLDIVFADTVGSISEEKIDFILKNVNYDLIDYISLHLHSDKNFYPYINKSLEYNIKKFDSSLLGIGGCPFAKKEIIGNISTYNLVKYLHSQGYNTNLNLNKLKETQIILKDLLKTF